MNKILYISESYIKDNSEVQETVDIKKIMRSAFNVQTLYIEPLLGTALKDELETKISGNTITGEYELLYSVYIKPIVLNYSLWKATPFLSFSITNKSIVKKEADNTISAELSEVKYLANEYKEMGDALTKQAILYLMQMHQDGYFPLYSTTYNQKLYEMKPDKENPYLFGGIFLGDL